MKDNHFVHGDFRAANVLGVMRQGEFEGQVVVIDFNWSGHSKVPVAIKL
jgi:thiamine kinase-like enzyme